MAVTAVAAPQGFVATVQAAYNGSKVQWAVNGIWSVLGTVFSTLVAHKWKTMGVIGLIAAVAYNWDDIKAVGRAMWIKASASENESKADAARKRSGGGDPSAASTAATAGGASGGGALDKKGPN